MHLPQFLIATKIGGEAAKGITATGNTLWAAEYAAGLAAVEEWQAANPGKPVPSLSTAVMDIE